MAAAAAAMTPAELVAEITRAREGWINSMPKEVSPTQGRALADFALADARATVLAVADQYHGTLPPPPWPAPPELVAQRRRVQAIRDGFETLERRAPNVHLLPAVTESLRREGTVLYDRLVELARKSAAAPRLPDLLKLIPDPRRLVAGGLPIVALVVVGIYFLERGGRRRLAN